jgi:hypothetical protein
LVHLLNYPHQPRQGSSSMGTHFPLLRVSPGAGENSVSTASSAMSTNPNEPTIAGLATGVYLTWTTIGNTYLDIVRGSTPALGSTTGRPSC